MNFGAQVMWPTSSRLQIAETLYRSPPAIGSKLTCLRQKGFLQGTRNTRQKTTRSITPDQKDFDAVKSDYCRKHHIDEAPLSARFEADNQLAAKLYRQAVAAKTTRLRTFG
jgi:hypothetical protein